MTCFTCSLGHAMLYRTEYKRIAIRVNAWRAVPVISAPPRGSLGPKLTRDVTGRRAYMYDGARWRVY